MKKLFFLIPAMLLAATVSYAEYRYPDAATENSLRSAVSAAAAGDVIVLDGTYGNTTNGYITISKNLTIQVADGKTATIKPEAPIQVKSGASVKFIGIKFDGTSIGGYDYFIRFDDTDVNNAIEFEDCEFTSITKTTIYVKGGMNGKSVKLTNCTFHDNSNYCIWCPSTSTLGSCIINNCYFYNNTQMCLYLENTTATPLTISNSTFANNSNSGSHGVIETKSTSGDILVSHCTFYNCPASSTSYGTVKFVSPDAVVSNSIFAMPSSKDQIAIQMPSGNDVNNCLTYNYTSNTDGISAGIDKTACATGNPYFINADPNNYDFTPASFSPAHLSGTDSKDMGDYQRWTSDDSAHSTTKNLTAGDDAIRAAVEASWPNDNIVLATGTYNESASIAIDKNITIKAANGASPIVKPVGNFTISNAADVTIQNIKFDGSDQSGVSNFIYAADATSNSLAVEGCEFYNFGNAVIYAATATLIGTCSIDDCYFHNNTKGCIIISNTAAADLTVTNSTFANNSTSSKGTIEDLTATGDVVVDHCTFYNCTVENTDHGMVGAYSSSTSVSNNIFSMPSSTDNLRAIYYPDNENSYETKNCLVYNLTKDSNTGIRKGTKTNCIYTNPRFDSISYNKYTVDEDSPARQAATDRTDLGDPRWYRARTIHETDFASPYPFAATRAERNQYCTLDENNYLKSNNPNPIVSECSMATWKIHSTRAVSVQVTLDMASTSQYDHQYKVEIFDADETKIGEVGEASRNDTKTAIDVPGIINLSAAGDYTIKLSNTVAGSVARIQSITLSYGGGDVQTITNTDDFETNISDAYFSANGTRADGKISFSGSAVASEWARWNVTVANSDYYNITLNSAVESGHVYSVTFYDGETQVAQVAESGWHNTTGALPLGRRFLPAGNYVMEIKNSVESNSNAKIVSVEAVAFVAPTTALPATLKANDAIMSELAYAASTDADETALYFVPSGKEGQILDQWAQWKVSVAADASTYLFTMNVSSSETTQSYKITILDSETNEIDYCTRNPGSGDKTLKHYFYFAEAGTYYVKVQNTTKWSNGHIVSLVVSDLPDGLITLDEDGDPETVNGIISDNQNVSGKTIQLIRTIVGGMYNTICLPFEVSSSQCKEIFGNDVQLRTLGSADVEEGGFVLNLSFNNASDIYPGTPLLIKTSRDIVNPVFIGVEITRTTPSSTSKANADFKGNFVKGTIDADPNNLFLGAENTLYFPTTDIDILGMRAYFKVHDAPGAPAGMIRRARIVENEQVVTEIELVSQEPTVNNQKLLINGQLIIVRDGVRYNVMGARVQ